MRFLKDYLFGHFYYAYALGNILKKALINKSES